MLKINETELASEMSPIEYTLGLEETKNQNMTSNLCFGFLCRVLNFISLVER